METAIETSDAERYSPWLVLLISPIAYAHLGTVVATGQLFTSLLTPSGYIGGAVGLVVGIAIFLDDTLGGESEGEPTELFAWAMLAAPAIVGVLQLLRRLETIYLRGSGRIERSGRSRCRCWTGSPDSG